MGIIHRAKMIDSVLAPWKRENAHGRVMGVYRKCFNILTDEGRIVGVFTDIDGLMPLGIITDTDPKQEFSRSSIQSGDEVFVSGGILSVPCGGFECVLTDAVTRELRRCIASGTEKKTLEEQSRVFSRLLGEYGRKNGEGAHFDQWRDFLFRGVEPPRSLKILSALAELYSAAASGDPGKTELCFNKTVGAGIGLTPSADDVICGMADAMYTFGGKKGEIFLSALSEYVKKQGRERTTLISAQQLEQSAEGVMSDTVFALLCAVARNAPEELLKRELCRALDHGSSSGTELCMGILAGCCLANTVC